MCYLVLIMRVCAGCHIVEDLFGGELLQSIQCHRCGYSSQRREALRPRTRVDLVGDEACAAQGFRWLDATVKGFTCLEDSLCHMFGVEEVSGDNQYRCSQCNIKVNASKCIRWRTKSLRVPSPWGFHVCSD